MTGATAVADESLRNQLSAAHPPAGQSDSNTNRMSQVVEEDDNAAPAPIVRKREPKAAAAAAGPKRKSFFGIPLGKPKRVLAT